MGSAQFCRQCGARLQSGSAGYGVASAAYPAGGGAGLPAWALPRTRVEQHSQTLGIAFVIYGAFRLVSLLFLGIAFRTVLDGGMLGGLPPGVSELIAGSIPLVVLGILLVSALDVAAGIALLKRRPSARVLALVAGCLALLKLPFGTALGAYTLWVLAPAASREEWTELTAVR